MNNLNEKLFREAEKQLHNLVCYQTDKRIRIKFIEGCILNLKNNK
jgi:ubiquitin carboxyl-terminal hydrolase 34